MAKPKSVRHVTLRRAKTRKQILPNNNPIFYKHLLVTKAAKMSKTESFALGTLKNLTLNCVCCDLIANGRCREGVKL